MEKLKEALLKDIFDPVKVSAFEKDIASVELRIENVRARKPHNKDLPYVDDYMEYQCDVVTVAKMKDRRTLEVDRQKEKVFGGDGTMTLIVEIPFVLMRLEW